MNTTTAGVRPPPARKGDGPPAPGSATGYRAAARRRPPGVLVPALRADANRDYRRSRFQTDRRIEIETRVLGVLVRRR